MQWAFFVEKGVQEMKKIFFLFVILSQVLTVSYCHAGGTFTGTFQMSMTIPAILGVNVSDPDKTTNIQSPLMLAENVVSSMETQLTEEMIVRGYQNIHLQTLVVR